MAALDDLKNRIATELKRSDLTDSIAAAVTSAIKLYKFRRFAFNETSDTLATVDGTREYTTATGLPDDIIEIDSATVAISATRSYDLIPVPFPTLNQWSGANLTTGYPTHYAWQGENLFLYPTPNAVYTITLKYHADVAEETWAQRAEAMIRLAAKRDLYLNLLEDDANAARASSGERTEFAALISEMYRKQSLGQLTAHD